MLCRPVFLKAMLGEGAPLLSFLLLTSILAVGQRPAAADSLPLAFARWVTPVTLTPVTTRHGPGVRLEYGRPCLAEAGTRLRTLRHNFGRRGFVLVQYRTPYSTAAGHCPSGTLFFLPRKETTKVKP
jgi:hypothetical protein